MHGKDVADGEGMAVKGMVKNSFHDYYGEETQNLVRHLAYKYPRPNIERLTRYCGEREGFMQQQIMRVCTSLTMESIIA